LKSCASTVFFFKPHIVNSCHTTPTQKLFLFACLSSGWVATTGRVDCLNPRWEIALSVFSNDTATRYQLRVEPRFRNLSITRPAFYHLSHATVTTTAVINCRSAGSIEPFKQDETRLQAERQILYCARKERHPKVSIELGNLAIVSPMRYRYI